MEALKRRRSELLAELDKVERALARQVKCGTCGYILGAKVAIVNTRCPHGDPANPTYQECRFCSDTCRFAHKNAVD